MKDNNTENIKTLKDFYELDTVNVNQRAHEFANFLKKEKESGLPVAREIVSPAANRVMVKNFRTGQIREMVMFGSNNYLGLATNPVVFEKIKKYVNTYGVGLGGPPLLNGNTAIHIRLEEKLAELKNTQAALICSSGYGANYGVVKALLGKNDILILDELSHASTKDGASTCRGKVIEFTHNDVQDLANKLAETKKTGKVSKFVAVEGVYSMDGDLAPLDKICKVATDNDAIIILDDAHGTGVMGKNGRGLCEHFGVDGKIDIVMGTFSKAFAATGGFLAASREVIDYLRFFMRTYFFSAAPSPLLVAQILSAIETLEEQPELLDRLHKNVKYLIRGLNQIGLSVNTESAIIVVQVPEDTNIRKVATDFDQAGVFINHIEYPACPLNKQRFRISVMATHEKEDMDKLIEAFSVLGNKHGLWNSNSTK